jgi:Zn-finger nucleic acid-binding protein
MKCPTCNVDLKMAERQNIEIDFCPQCRGVWLDRGELDKIIERSAPVRPEGRGAETERPDPRFRDDDEDDDRRRWRDDEDRYRGRKRKSFLSELFDF